MQPFDLSTEGEITLFNVSLFSVTIFLLREHHGKYSISERQFIFGSRLRKTENRLILGPCPGLKVPKCEIFDRSDFDEFYTKKSLWGGDFGG